LLINIDSYVRSLYTSDLKAFPGDPRARKPQSCGKRHAVPLWQHDMELLVDRFSVNDDITEGDEVANGDDRGGSTMASGASKD
jgi:hypothetical protein